MTSMDRHARLRAEHLVDVLATAGAVEPAPPQPRTMDDCPRCGATVTALTADDLHPRTTGRTVPCGHVARITVWPDRIELT